MKKISFLNLISIVFFFISCNNQQREPELKTAPALEKNNSKDSADVKKAIALALNHDPV